MPSFRWNIKPWNRITHEFYIVMKNYLSWLYACYSKTEAKKSKFFPSTTWVKHIQGKKSNLWYAILLIETSFTWNIKAWHPKHLWIIYIYSDDKIFTSTICWLEEAWRKKFKNTLLSSNLNKTCFSAIGQIDLFMIWLQEMNRILGHISKNVVYYDHILCHLQYSRTSIIRANWNR